MGRSKHGRRNAASALVLAAAVVACARVTAVNAGAASPSKRPLTPDDYYNTQTVTEPQVSPDGQWVAYVVSTNDREADETRSAIWMVSWDGTQHVALTNPAKDISAPRWSPDGRYLAYIADTSCSDKSQIMLLDRRGGEAKAITRVRDDIQSYEWAPDGQRMVLVMDQGAAKPSPVAATALLNAASEDHAPTAASGKCLTTPEAPLPIVIDSLHFKEDKEGYLGSGHGRHLYLLDVEHRAVESVTHDPDFNEGSPAWSPDGHRLAFVRTREKSSPDLDGMQDLDVVEARAGATPTKLQRIFVPNTQKLAWSADGLQIAFLQGVEARYNQYAQDALWLIESSAAVSSAGESGGAAARGLTATLDRPVSSYVFGKRAIIATIEDDTTAYAVSINVRGNAVNKLAQGSFVVSDVTGAVGHTALLYSDDGSPAEVYALEGAHLRKLTHHNETFIDGLELGAVQDLRFNSRDGTPIHGLVVKPPQFDPTRKYPALLWIHGGPNLQDSHSLSFDDYQFKRQMLAAQGFVVYGINYRGSTAKGYEFARAIAADWGHKEVEDLLAGTDALLQTGWVDPDRLVIGGWSYGGMLTDYTIASTMRFKAAASGAGTANPLALYGADQYNLQYAAELGDPWRNTDLYIKLAYPFLHVDRIHTPTLFLGGSKDFNVPIVGGEQMYLALRTLGVPAELVVYPGEFHTLTRPSFLKDRVERLGNWYRQYTPDSAQH